MILLDGKKVSIDKNNDLKIEISKYLDKGFRKPGLAVVMVGNNPASEAYVRNKIRACNRVGINGNLIKLEEDVTREEIIKIVNDLNMDESIDGIIVQLPLPDHLDASEILNLIDPSKDVDGFTTHQQGLLFQGKAEFLPATPKGVAELLEAYNIDPSGMDVCVVGRSQIVGLPMAKILNDLNGTVTVCHRRTKDLVHHTKHADILVVAVGVPKLIKKDMVKEGVIVVDVGINRVDDKLVGDVDFDEVSQVASYITPVPGGVGPMTISMLLKNTFQSYLNKI